MSALGEAGSKAWGPHLSERVRLFELLRKIPGVDPMNYANSTIEELAVRLAAHETEDTAPPSDGGGND